jgi:hypothetical protein
MPLIRALIQVGAGREKVILKKKLIIFTKYEIGSPDPLPDGLFLTFGAFNLNYFSNKMIFSLYPSRWKAKQ